MAEQLDVLKSAGEDYIAHHGIKEQKWGVRRFQNPDGTLTEEGKKRYYSKDYEKAHSKNAYKYMDTKDLAESLNRLKLEREYKAYLEVSNAKKEKKKSWLGNLFSRLANESIPDAIVNAGRDYTKNVLMDILPMPPNEKKKLEDEKKKFAEEKQRLNENIKNQKELLKLEKENAKLQTDIKDLKNNNSDDNQSPAKGVKNKTWGTTESKSDKSTKEAYEDLVIKVENFGGKEKYVPLEMVVENYMKSDIGSSPISTYTSSSIDNDLADYLNNRKGIYRNRDGI